MSNDDAPTNQGGHLGLHLGGNGAVPPAAGNSSPTGEGNSGPVPILEGPRNAQDQHDGAPAANPLATQQAAPGPFAPAAIPTPGAANALTGNPLVADISAIKR